MNVGMTRTRRHVTDVLFSLALFCVFAAVSLIVVFIGAEVYGGVVNRSDESFEVNTTLSFVATKIRQHDMEDALRIGDLHGVPALVFMNPIGERVFETWIYHHEGVIREFVIDRDNIGAIGLGSGQVLVSVYDFSFEVIDDRLISITAKSENGSAGSMLVAFRSGRRIEGASL